MPAAIKISAPFASASDTAKELGVSDAKTQKLKALVVRFVRLGARSKSKTSVASVRGQFSKTSKSHLVHYVAKKAKWSTAKTAKKNR